MKMEQTECSETSAYKIQRVGNYPEESTQHSEHGESLKSKICFLSPPIFLYRGELNGVIVKNIIISKQWQLIGNKCNIYP